MYDRDDLTVIDTAGDLNSPLDAIAPEESESAAAPPPDPEEMLALLAAPHAPQRMLAARAFCDLKEARAIRPLLALLRDDCALVRVSAAYALGRNTAPEAVEPLIDQYERDWNGYVRKGIVWALGNHRDRRALPTLIKALATEIAAVRLWAASALAQMAELDYEDRVALVAPLIAALRRDTMPAVRSNCAWALGQLCRELPSNVVYATAIDALLEALVEDEDVGVTEDAKSALLGLGDPRGLRTIEELEREGLV